MYLLPNPVSPLFHLPSSLFSAVISLSLLSFSLNSVRKFDGPLKVDFREIGLHCILWFVESDQNIYDKFNMVNVGNSFSHSSQAYLKFCIGIFCPLQIFGKTACHNRTAVGRAEN